MRFWLVALWVASSPPTPPAQAISAEKKSPSECRVAEGTNVGPVHRLRNGARWLVDHTRAIPIIFYTPENHLGLGAGTFTTWTMRDAPVHRPSYLTLAGIYTTRQQAVASLRYELRGPFERLVLTQDVRYIDWPDRFFGVGNATKAGDRENFTDRYFQIETQYLLRVWRRLFLGLHQIVRQSETRNLPESPRWLDSRRLYGVGALFWSGLGLTSIVDSRDSVFWPTRGQYLSLSTMLYDPVFGSSFRAGRVQGDFRQYQRLFRHHILVFRGVMQVVGGRVPFQLLPQLGGSDLFRGWYFGRLRDRKLLATEVESRQEIGRRWAVVGFGSLAKVGSKWEMLWHNSWHGAIGGGFRYAIKKGERAHVRLDFAYGDGFNVYLQFREAF
jgi:hypothetical protein